jgi:hypothetical protein
VFERSGWFPGEGLPPKTKRPIFVQNFIVSVKNSLVVDMCGIPDEHFPFVFFLLIFVKLLNFHPRNMFPIELLKNILRKDVGEFNLILGVLLLRVDVAQDLQNCRPQRF